MRDPRDNQDGRLQLSIVIPCLNESETIAACVKEALEGLRLTGLSGEVLIADNGSTDNSQQIATHCGARVVNVRDRGYGAALNGGIQAAFGEIVVFGDADMSYPFLEIPKLIQPLLSGEADFVLGSRLKGTIEKRAMPKLNRYIGTPILTFLIRLIYRLPMSDCNSGMRAFRRSIYPSLNLRCPGMEYASEMVISIAMQKVKYAEVPIGFRKDRRSRPPHLKRWRDGWRHLRFILGNAPSIPLIVVPGLLGFGFLMIAFALSFGRLFKPGGSIHFHTALSLIALATPLILFTNMLLLIRTASSEAKVRDSRLVNRLMRFSENSAPFYIAAIFFAAAIIQVGIVFGIWWSNGFGALDEIGAIIRVIVFSILGMSIFSLDLGLGILKLLPYRPSATTE